MKNMVKNIVKGIVSAGILSILLFLTVVDARAQGPVLNRVEVKTDMVKDFGPVGVDGSVIVKGVELAEVGDSLLLAFAIEVNGRAINNRQDWRIVPGLAVEDGFVEFLPDILINGRQKERHYKRKMRFDNGWLLDNQPEYKTAIPKGTDTVITYHYTALYEPWMDDATLVLYQYLTSPRELKQLFAAINYGRVKIGSREAYQIEPSVNYILPEKEVKERSISAQANIDFPSGVSKIMPQYRGNPQELAKIDKDFRELLENEYVNIGAIYMEGYASPEGSYALNERLSRERVEALKDYLADKTGIDRNIIKTTTIPEDWDGFRAIIDTWYDGAGKDRILSIIESPDAPDVKEKRLRALSEWRLVLNEVFPPLRRTEYRIDYRVRDFTVEESRSLIEKSPELFSHRELYHLAMSYEDHAKRLETLETIVRYFPDDEVALNNYAAALIENGETPTAMRYLDRVEDGQVKSNNLGVALLLSGDYEEAKKYLQNSSFEQAKYNLEELERKVRDNAKMERYKTRR